ncbi:hypothetical protein C0993_005218 [Termitomyces sp. T159_Od127]|nr:hypothetical protein C0993_005218 [Termitomyces sp. T159_Od127]
MNKWARRPPSQSVTNATQRHPLPQPPSGSSSSSPARSLPGKWSRVAPSASQSVSQSSRPDAPSQSNTRVTRDFAPHLDTTLRDDAASYLRPKSQESLPSRGPLLYQNRKLGQNHPRQSVPHQSSPAQLSAVQDVKQSTLEKDSNSSVHERKTQRPVDPPLSNNLFESDFSQDQTSRATGKERQQDRRYGRPERAARTTFKERGTLLTGRNNSSLETEDPVQKQVKKIKKAAVEKKVSADVYIPSTVSVGTLARLLGVRLEQLQQRMRFSGMSQEAEYDYSSSLSNSILRSIDYFVVVLTADYAVLLAEEFGRNPIVNDEAAFDIYPPSVA